jgi:hypothetical protein
MKMVQNSVLMWLVLCGILGLKSFGGQMQHAKAGVEKGRASKTGLPIEIMGLMTGEIDTSSDYSLVVSDVVPIPVEGTETTVMTDNTDVQNYMIGQSEVIGEVNACLVHLR